MPSKKSKIKLKQILILATALLTMLSSLVFPGIRDYKVYAAAPSSLTLQDPIREWIMDEANGYIYAVSPSSNKLLFIRLSDFTVEKQLVLNSTPSDLVQFGGKLYVALSGEYYIAVIDIAQKSVESAIQVSYKPYELALDGNYLFYVANDHDNKVARYDLTNKSETFLNLGIGHFYEPDIAIDTAKHILYLGDTGTTSSVLSSFSTLTLQPLSTNSNYNSSGDGRIARKVIVDGDQVFYAGYAYKSTDLTSIQGSYQQSVSYVHGNYVFTNEALNNGNAAPAHAYLYDRDSFTKIADLPVASRRIVMDSHNHIYSYTGSDPWNPDLPNVIQIINPSMSSPGQVNTQSDGHNLSLDQAVTELVYSSDGSNLFAISSESNQLLRIRTSDMTVQERRSIGSKPTSIVNDHDILYVGFGLSNQIKKIDTLDGTSVSGAVYAWNTSNFVSQVVYGNQNLYYTTMADLSSIKVIDTVDGTQSQQSLPETSNGHMIISPTSNALYYAENNRSGKVLKFKLPDWSLQASSLDYNDPGAYSVMDNDSVYYASRRLDKDTLQPVTPWEKYPGSQVIYAHGNYVFTSVELYDKNSYTKQFLLPNAYKQAVTLPNGQVIMVTSDGKGVSKFDSIQALHDSSPSFKVPALQVANFFFGDSDPKVGEIGGYMTWNSTQGYSMINSYTVYFLDQNGSKIGNRIAEVTYDPSASAYYSYTLPVTSLPKEAVYLGLYTKNANGESSTAATTKIIDQGAGSTGNNGGSSPGGSSDGGYMEYYFEDQNTVQGRIHPLVSWLNSSEVNYSGYQLSFTDASGTVLSSYLVNKHTSPQSLYRISIAENVVPAEAVYLDLHPLDLSGHVGTLYRMRIFDNTLDSATTSNTITSLPVPGVVMPKFDDYDKSAGHIGGSINWYDSSTDLSATSYIVYFVDANNMKMKSIAEIKRSNLIHPNQGINLPTYEITLPEGVVVPNGASRLGIFGKNNQGEAVDGYYFGLWDVIAVDEDSSYFEDRDGREDHIKGDLHWAPILNESNIVKYQVQFLGDQFQPIGDVFAQVDKGKEQYEVSIEDNQIPLGAIIIQLLAVNATNEKYSLGVYSISDNMEDKTVASSPVDNQIINNIFSNFTDSDGDQGEIGGHFSFYPSSSNSSSIVTRYDVYVVNNQLQKLKPIMSLTNNHLGFYQTSIPYHTVVPNGGTQLAVYPVSANGEGTPTAIQLVDRVYSPALGAEQINITNNTEGKSDTIVITGLNTGDVIRTYHSASSSNPFLIARVVENSNSLTFTVDQLGKESGKLYFTLQRGNNTPSKKVEQVYTAEPVVPVTPPRVGGGGGGGGGGGSSQSPPSLEVDGKMHYDLTPPRIDLLIALNSDSSEIGLDARTKEKVDIVTVKFDADIIRIAASRNKSIVFKSNELKVVLPPDVFDIKSDENTIEFKASLVPAPAIPQHKAVSSVYDFLLKEKETVIASFKTPVQVTFAYDAAKVQDPTRLSVYVLDENTGTWNSVGGTLNSDGTITASLSHFSKYAVLEKSQETKTFLDIQDHWARKEIEQLSEKQIIDGMDDNSFQPDSNMTRAQFVTLLSKALKLRSQVSTRDFTDIKDSSWYKDSVYAAYEAHIVNGVSDHAFAPEANITREQMAVMMVNAYLQATGKKLEELPVMQGVAYTDDGVISDWAKSYVKAATGLNLMNGANEGEFAPQENTSRAQAAVVIYRLLNQVKP
ncbi:S-layer homology domain-containing protein [Paenibacillus sp. SI8]|uniref:S-layer homology domain-containing protein n=1 Tax=unclassified Paenibacillus TaxID=185978 RepID=UPI003466C8B9